MKYFLALWRRILFIRVPAVEDEVTQARKLIRAIDAGGVPLNPAKVNAIARALGLEVSRKAPVEDTLERIRAALKRV